MKQETTITENRLRRPYVRPATETVSVSGRIVMVYTSPGVGSGFDPTKPVDSKEGFFDDDEHLQIHNIWDE